MTVPITLAEDSMSQNWESGDIRHLSEFTPPHYSTPPRPFPTKIVGYRKLVPIVREYLRAVLDPLFRENHAMKWACYVVALGKLCDHHRVTVTSKSMFRELGTKRPLLLAEFIETWDSIPGPIPGVK